MNFTTADKSSHDSQGSSTLLPDVADLSAAHMPSAPEKNGSHDLYNNAPCGSYVIDSQGIFVSLNDTLLRWLGYSREDIVGRLRISDLLGPSCNDKRNLLLDSAQDCCFVQDLELELRRQDGTAFFGLMNSVPVYDGAGECTGNRAVIFDITIRKQAEEDLRESQERLRLALQAGRMGIWDWDIHTGKVHWSGDGAVLHDLTPIPAEEAGYGKLSSNSYLPTIHEAERDDVVDIINNAIADGGEYTAEYRVVGQDGSIRWISGRGWIQLDDHGDPERIRGIAQDITERKEAEHKIAELATTDGLTNLKNHRAFQECLLREIVRARRYGHDLSLLMLDVDYFKQYNDTFGHPEGDKVLQKVAECLSAHCRETDFAARYGGEEFSVILPETSCEQALLVAERIRVALPEIQGLQRSITASIGVACHIPDSINRTPEEARRDLIVRADSAMYEAKHGGRNRVCGHSHP